MRPPTIFSATLLLLTALLASCSQESDSNSNSYTSNSGDSRRAVIIYMAAQNSLGYLEPGYSSASLLDSAEIVRGVAKLSNSQDNVFLFIDDDKKPRLYWLRRQGSGSGMRTLMSKVLTWADDVSSADPATLRDVLIYVAQNCPSLSYGLVMWSHGNGWLMSTNVSSSLDASRSIVVDVGAKGDMASDTDFNGNMGAQMNIADMASAIRLSGLHMDYIFFDACLMQNIEVAYELREVADYVVGNANSTSAYGAYYTDLIPNALLAYPANDENVAKIANQFYYDAVVNPDLHIYYGEVGNANSVIKTAHIEQLAYATGLYINKVIADRRSPEMQGVQAYSTSAVFNSPDYHDMGSAMHHLLSEEDYLAWREVAEQCVIAHNASESYSLGMVGELNLVATLDDADHVLGVSMFIPQSIFDNAPYSPYNAQFRRTAWYAAANWAQTGW